MKHLNKTAVVQNKSESDYSFITKQKQKEKQRKLAEEFQGECLGENT